MRIDMKWVEALMIFYTKITTSYNSVFKKRFSRNHQHWKILYKKFKGSIDLTMIQIARFVQDQRYISLS